MSAAAGRWGLHGSSPHAHARITGAVGLLLLASGSLSVFVMSQILVRGDAAATMRNVVGSQALFRFGITCTIAMMIAWLMYALLLYRLLRPVHAGYAGIMLGLVMAAVPLYMLNQVNAFAMLTLAQQGLVDQVGFFFKLLGFGNLIGALFFGLWLLPLGWLVLRSRFLPKLLGALLMAGSVGYVVVFIESFHIPGSVRGLWGNPLLLITHLAELALMIWLLFRGVNDERWHECHRGSGSAV